jgi:site-specific recombinase XerD
MATSANTVRAYESDLKRITGIAGSVDLYDHERFINAIESYRTSKKEPLGLSAKKRYFVTLHHYTKDNPTVNEIYRSKFIKINEELTEIASKQAKTEKEEEKWLTWPEIQAVGKTMMANTKESLENRIIAGLYTQMPPARLDYVNLRVYDGPAPSSATGNFIESRVSPGVSMIINIQEHKTQKKYPYLTRNVPTSVVNLIKEWMSANPSQHTLFEDWSAQSLGKRIQGIFRRATGKDASLNILRHAYVTHEREGDMPLTKKNELSMTMGHSGMMNDVYRRL